MNTRIRRLAWLGIIGASLLLPGATCTTTTDTQSGLADLVASTSGGLVELLVKNFLDLRLPGGNDPELQAPISEQEK